MNKYLTGAAAAGISFAFVAEAAATEWNVSMWGKRRAFTEHVEKLAELVSAKTNGEFTINMAYGETLSKNRENLDGISIGAFEMSSLAPRPSAQAARAEPAGLRWRPWLPSGG